MKSTGFWKSQTKPTPASRGVSSSATSCPKWRNFFSMRHESRAWKPASRMPPSVPLAALPSPAAPSPSISASKTWRASVAGT